MVSLQVRAATGEDWVEVSHTDKSGRTYTLYFGPLDKYRDPRGRKLPLYDKQPIVK
jgi:hypothetical protein